jgi:GT2 family glycosyltransferase
VVSLSHSSISAIVPTIGRPESLRRLLESLEFQTQRINEVIIADGSDSSETASVVSDPRWQRVGLNLTRICVHPPNAVDQRKAAIKLATGDFLLFLDDDVVLERDCVERMFELLEANPDVVGATAHFSNQQWPKPTKLWHLYLFLSRVRNGGWQGRVLGPLLRFGYNPVPEEAASTEWLGTGNSLVRHLAYDQSGGFSDFFLYRSTINEDIDLSLKLTKIGRLLFCPSARMAHHRASEGRVSRAVAAEDDLFNRFCILRWTVGKGLVLSLFFVTLYLGVETVSHLALAIRRWSFGDSLEPVRGYLRAVRRIMRGIWWDRPTMTETR